MKVGDYVRTPKGIGKIMKKYSDSKDSFIDLDCGITIDYITKDFTEKEICEMYATSPNIIDLIEVGDYVNGKHVDKYQGKLGVFCELPNGKWEFIELTNEHYLISSIVTKEQFSCMEYKIGE